MLNGKYLTDVSEKLAAFMYLQINITSYPVKLDVTQNGST
jgi:hypothetical protein